MKIRGSNLWKICILLTLAAIAVVVTVSFAGKSPEKDAVPSTTDSGVTSPGFYKNVEGSSKAVLAVQGMSCSGCVDTINKALAGFKGIQEIVIDVSAGRAELYFDDEILQDMDRITAAIREAGYPARLDKVIPAEQVKNELGVMAERSRLYVVSVGDLDISRKDMDKEITYAKKQYIGKYGEGVFATDRGKALLKSLKAQILSQLIDDGIQRQEIRKAGFTLEKAAVDKAYKEFLAKKGMDSDTFKASLDNNGLSFDRFMKRFEFRVLVSQYLDSEILMGTSNEFERQQRYFDWFNNSKVLAKVVYYDKDLEQLVQNRSSGCGGCSSGGGCPGSRGKK
jgi:copper chaperone